MSFPDPDPTPTLISGEQMSKLLAVNDVHPQSNLARNCMRGHFYLDALDGKQYAVAAWFDSQDEQSAATPSRAARHEESALDSGDLVARAMGLPMPSKPVGSPQDSAVLESLEFASPQARRNFELVASAMWGDR